MLEDYKQSASPPNSIYVVSDLHLGDGGPRDNAAIGSRELEFLAFLDMVEAEGAQLIILGDLFEFWQASISKVIMRHLVLLDRLARMQAVYVLGNHDTDLLYFCGTKMLSHPFFECMTPDCVVEKGGRKIKLVHGHQFDSYCKSDVPGKGRISAIYAGLWEDRNGSPWIGKYKTVEEATVGRIEKCLSFAAKLCGRPDRLQQIYQQLFSTYFTVYDAVIFGHTHRAGTRGYLFNSGTWAEKINSFVRIDNDGTVGVYDWIENKVVVNDHQLT